MTLTVTDIPERILARMDLNGPPPPDPWRPVEGGCWLWTGGTFPAGYGSISVDNESKLVHRLVTKLRSVESQRATRSTTSAVFERVPGLNTSEPVTNAQNSRRGAKAKLTWQQLRDIRRLGASTQLSQRELARRLGIHPTTVQNILAGRRWRETT